MSWPVTNAVINKLSGLTLRISETTNLPESFYFFESKFSEDTRQRRGRSLLISKKLLPK